ncbi:MAG: LPS export ABC transporter permease LptF [Proteobacteria bacterium]|nr:LPS export ABC transporter permease LptF [Pseudomonadota bacterium]
MLTIDRYLLRELAATVAATTTVLLFVALGAVVADLMQEIALGKVPVALGLSQLGLRMLRWLPMVLPLGVFLGLLLGIGRLYRDSEMAVLTASGRSPRDLLRPLAWVAVPLAALVAACSLWIGPWAQHTSRSMIAAANRSLLIAGLEAGRFRSLPSGDGVLYVTELSTDGSKMKNVFIQSDKKGRMSVITAKRGELFVDGGERYLRLLDGMRVDGVPGQKDYRVLRYQRSEIRLPADAAANTQQDASSASTGDLLGSDKRDARAELNWRIATPIAVLLLALLALPLARSEPRQPRYDLLLLALALYVTYTSLMLVGRSYLVAGKIHGWLGLWWLHLPLLLLGLWLLRRDGAVRAPRAVRP